MKKNTYKDEQIQLAKIINVPPPDKFSQDWEYEVTVSPTEIKKLFNVYRDYELTVNQKRSLLKIIIETINDSIPDEDFELKDECLNKLITLITQDKSIYRDILDIYICVDEPLDNCFAITPFIRKIFKNLYRTN